MLGKEGHHWRTKCADSGYHGGKGKGLGNDGAGSGRRREEVVLEVDDEAAVDEEGEDEVVEEVDEDVVEDVCEFDGPARAEPFPFNIGMLLLPRSAAVAVADDDVVDGGPLTMTLAIVISSSLSSSSSSSSLMSCMCILICSWGIAGKTNFFLSVRAGGTLLLMTGVAVFCVCRVPGIKDTEPSSAGSWVVNVRRSERG